MYTVCLVGAIEMRVSEGEAGVYWRIVEDG